jgi:hypothetical protein
MHEERRRRDDVRSMLLGGKLMPRLVFDKKTTRPMCVLIQAAYGGDISAVHIFDSEDWLLFPEGEMVGVNTSREILQEHAKRLSARRARRRGKRW